MTSPPSDDDPFLTLSEDLIASPPSLPSARIALSFSGLLSPPLLLESDPRPGCGGQLWPAGEVLAHYLLSCRMADLGGKTM